MTTRLIAWLDQWAGPIALQTAVVATLILVVALLVGVGLRRSAASLRHRVWALAILGLLAYPLVQPFLPKLSLGLRMASSENLSKIEPTATNSPVSPLFPHHALLPVQGRDFAEETAGRTSPAAVPLPLSKPQVADDGGIRPSLAETLARAFAFHWPSILAAVWAVGAVIGLGCLVTVHLAASRLVRTGKSPSDPSWLEMAAIVAAQLGVRRHVAVCTSDGIAVPLTAGWLRPAILLPSQCDGWAGPRRRMVLIHELSHVARGDILWQIAAKFACVVYWLHPLVWLAARRMRVEREAACDDAVLRDVDRPSEYASLLLDVAASLADRPVSMSAAVAMAHGRSVEERIRWIVQPGRCRLPIGRRTAWWLSVGAILLVLAVGSIRLFAGPPVPTPSEPTTDQDRLAEKTPPLSAKQPDRAGVSERAEMAKPVLRQRPQQPTPPELVKKLLEANRCWLRPNPKYLSYTFSMEHPRKNDPYRVHVQYADERMLIRALSSEGEESILKLRLGDGDDPRVSAYPRQMMLLQGVILYGPLQELARAPEGRVVSAVGEATVGGVSARVLHLKPRMRDIDEEAILLWDARLRQQATRDNHFDEKLYKKLKSESRAPKPGLPLCVGCGVFGSSYGYSQERQVDVDQLWVEKATDRILREEGFFEGEPRFVVTYGDYKKTSDNGEVPCRIEVQLLLSSVNNDPWEFQMEFQVLNGSTWLLKELKESQGKQRNVAIASIDNASVSPPRGSEPQQQSSSVSPLPDGQPAAAATRDAATPSDMQPSKAKPARKNSARFHLVRGNTTWIGTDDAPLQYDDYDKLCYWLWDPHIVVLPRPTEGFFDFYCQRTLSPGVGRMDVSRATWPSGQPANITMSGTIDLPTYQLLLQPSVQRALNLSKQQRTKLQNISAKYWTERRQIAGKALDDMEAKSQREMTAENARVGREGSVQSSTGPLDGSASPFSEKVIEKLESQWNSARKQIEDVLTSEQLRMLKELTFRTFAFGSGAMFEPEFVGQLGVTKDQQDRLRALELQLQKEKDRRLRSVIAEKMKKMLAVLTPQQLSELRKRQHLEQYPDCSMYPYPTLLLPHMPDTGAAEELGLSEQQQSLVRKVVAAHWKSLQLNEHKLTLGDEKGRQAISEKRRQETADLRKQIEAALMPKQWARCNEIAFENLAVPYLRIVVSQVPGEIGLTQRMAAAASITVGMGLTSQQTNSLREIDAEYFDKPEQIYRELTDKALTAFTPAQQEKLRAELDRRGW